jgi:hypothetical protein
VKRFFCVVVVFLFAACAVPRVEYKIVEVPVVCDVEMPVRPILSEEVVLKVVDLLEYTALLETAFKACKGEVQ